MIFVCVGSREYQFNRLLKEIDRLIECGCIHEEVFEQIGSSDYIPKRCAYSKYISKEEFSFYLDKARLVITHGGTASITQALNLGKNVIAVTRLKKYGEHIDDHQTQIVSVLAEQNSIKGVVEISELEPAIRFFEKNNLKRVESNDINAVSIVELIDDFISGK